MNTGPGPAAAPARRLGELARARSGCSMRTDRARVTGAAIATPSISWMPRWRTPPAGEVFVLLTWPPSTSSSRLSRHAPASAVTMLVRPGPAVTSANARPSPPDSLKYSTAMPGRDLVHERDARHPRAHPVEQVHDVAAGDEEAVGVALFVEPLDERSAYFVVAVEPLVTGDRCPVV